MPDGKFTNVTTGQPFQPRADTWNAFIAAAEAHEKVGPVQTDANQHQLPISCSAVLVLNDSGQALQKHNIVGLDTSLLTPDTDFQQEPGFEVILPAAASHKRAFGILAEDLANGDVGLCGIAGPCWTKVEVVNAAHEVATITDADETKLTSGADGIPILWKESGTGTKWAIVLAGQEAPPSHIRGDADAAISAGGTGNLSNVVGINRAIGTTTATGVYLDTTHIDVQTGHRVWAMWSHLNDRYEIYAADCS